jgi:amino-acid N-acetyltransferase
MSNRQGQVDWFRSAAPYITAHRGRTLVVQFGGEALLDERFADLIHDFALLHSLGLKLILVHGARPQIEAGAAALGLEGAATGAMRITTPELLPVVKRAIGEVRLEVEALLSMGLVNSPMAGSRIRVASGNFVVARPKGVRDGIDFQHTGEVRRVDTEAIRDNLDDGAVVLVSPLGYSPTGEIFNLLAEDLATALAVELRAHKVVFLRETAGLPDEGGAHLAELGLKQAKARLAGMRREADDEGNMAHLLGNAIHACRNGVSRAHVLDRREPGALLLELYTRDGIGTMVYADPYDATRTATIDDIGGILDLIEPLERDGALVRRSREKLEAEIARFMVVERDGTIIACAAIYPYPETGVAELACLAVHADYRRSRRGDALLDAVESEARTARLHRLFVLTTRATHWFKERGFVDANLDDLPVEKRSLYNYERCSKVLVKSLD